MLYVLMRTYNIACDYIVWVAGIQCCMRYNVVCACMYIQYCMWHYSKVLPRFVLKGLIYNPMDVMSCLMTRRGYKMQGLTFTIRMIGKTLPNIHIYSFWLRPILGFLSEYLPKIACVTYWFCMIYVILQNQGNSLSGIMFD